MHSNSSSMERHNGPFVKGGDALLECLALFDISGSVAIFGRARDDGEDDFFLEGVVDKEGDRREGAGGGWFGSGR